MLRIATNVMLFKNCSRSRFERYFCSPMLSVLLCLMCTYSLSLGSSDENDNGSNPFDTFFPGLTTEKSKGSMYRMFMFKNNPTPTVMPPPPGYRGRITESTTSTTTEEPEDVEGDFKIIPIAKPVGNGHPFMDKDGKRGKKTY